MTRGKPDVKKKRWSRPQAKELVILDTESILDMLAIGESIYLLKSDNHSIPKS